MNKLFAISEGCERSAAAEGWDEAATIASGSNSLALVDVALFAERTPKFSGNTDFSCSRSATGGARTRNRRTVSIAITSTISLSTSTNLERKARLQNWRFGLVIAARYRFGGAQARKNYTSRWPGFAS